ncbi:MAG: tRNA uridine-5-carboxymethylaminomethyl(34) synthesis GTPase MnmE [Treponema sp.]|nr:tRNA uridine-5-carboxymethylaminomethyl(34) synthesis GTPase MnmE [Treponema sp.]
MALNQYTPEEPISSIATALAPAALGIVRVSGKNCIELISKVFSRPKALLEAAGNTLVYGWIQDAASQNKGEKSRIYDEVMLGVYRGPKSFTGEDMVEIFCHGGPAVVTSIHSLLLKNGFRQALPGEYTFRAYINGKADLTKAEAVKEIIDSHTNVSQQHAAGRLSGSLRQEIDDIKKLIVDTIAAIEVEIEYPEDEETIADSFDSSALKAAIKRLQALSDSWKGEKLYQDGARVVLCGRTNAGKSSLFNAILKEERAIVSEIEGTTRDWLESWASINGIPVRLFDTAGLRKTDDVIEARGVELTKNLSQEADLVLYLVDSTGGMNDEDRDFIKNCAEPLVLVWTKADKNIANSDLKTQSDRLKVDLPVEEVLLSSKTGEGLKELFAKIYSILTQGIKTDREQAGIGSLRQKKAVDEALECVKHSLISAEEDYALDAVVQDLEDTLDCLAEIVGEVTPDDVLGSIFANFCVGK